MKRLVVDMDDELHKAVRIAAIRQGKTTKNFATDIIKEYLETKKEQTQ